MTFEYKLVYNKPSPQQTEETLNALAVDGWRVVGVTDNQIFLERGVSDEVKTLLVEDKVSEPSITE